MMDSIQRQLFSLADPAYREFHSRLIPTVDQNTIIGVRVPALRSLAKKLRQTIDTDPFMKELPHKYYEENNLHAFLIEQISDYEACVAALERFLPYVDNWATCDSLRPKYLTGHRKQLLEQIHKWISSDRTYTVRFAIEMLMVHFLDAEFDKAYLQIVAAVKSGEYYINMMIAWYFATALAKQWDQAVIYLEQKKLPVWIHNKTIQKAMESYRIKPDQKRYLRTLRV